LNEFITNSDAEIKNLNLKLFFSCK